MVTRLPDDYSEMKSFPNSISKVEKKMLEKSDIVFAVSKNLVNKKKNIRKDISYLANGVELGNFIRNKYDEPKEFKNNFNKKCTYVGAKGLKYIKGI